jgi:hypothetical protein
MSMKGQPFCDDGGCGECDYCARFYADKPRIALGGSVTCARCGESVKVVKVGPVFHGFDAAHRADVRILAYGVDGVVSR